MALIKQEAGNTFMDIAAIIGLVVSALIGILKVYQFWKSGRAPAPDHTEIVNEPQHKALDVDRDTAFRDLGIGMLSIPDKRPDSGDLGEDGDSGAGKASTPPADDGPEGT